MAGLFATGRVVDLILALVALEAAALLALRHRVGTGPRRTGLLAHLASGACLLVGIRLALIQGWWGWIGASLTAALGFHLIALWQVFAAPRDPTRVADPN